MALPNNTFIAELIHPGNVSTKRTHEDSWLPIPFEDISSLIGTDFTFYASPYSGDLPV